ncbi:hypothetical protein N9N28_09580 [Rubripirellula amarantea]|nr:hypothetical protein [Rubripirellula amarantea]
MNARLFAVIIAMIVACVPQVMVKVPYAPEQAKSTDFLALLALPVVLLMCRYRGYAKRIALVSLLAVGFAVTVMSLRMLLDDNRHLYLLDTPQLGRLFSIHVPLFLVAAMPLDRKWLTRCLIVFGALAVAVTLIIATLYHFGSTAFDAHQTFQRDGGELFHRLGGLQGETGAFAFNATIGIQILLAGLAMAGRKRLFWIGLWCVLPVYLAFIYHESLVRVSVLNTLVFFAFSVLGVNHSAAKSRFAMRGFVLLGAMLVLLLSVTEYPILDVEIERANMDGNLNQLSSGRVAHWIAGIEQTFDSPTYAIFGMGYRAPEFVLGHPVENFFVFHLATYGLLGSALFFALYGVLAWPTVRSALRGDFASGIFTAMMLAVVMQWQVNDVNLYYQTFPVLLFFSAWFASINWQENASRESGSTVVAKTADV